MRRIALIGLMLMLLVACTTQVQPTATPIQPAQFNLPTTVAVANSPTPLPTATPVPTASPIPTVTPITGVPTIEVTLDEPTWAFSLETTLTFTATNIVLVGWSFDGKYLLYWHDQTLHMLTMATQEISTIAQSTTMRSPTWSPDNNHTIAYITEDFSDSKAIIYTVWTYDINTQTSVSIGEFSMTRIPNTYWVPPITWTPEGIFGSNNQDVLKFDPTQSQTNPTIPWALSATFSAASADSIPSVSIAPNGRFAVVING